MLYRTGGVGTVVTVRVPTVTDRVVVVFFVGSLWNWRVEAFRGVGFSGYLKLSYHPQEAGNFPAR